MLDNSELAHVERQIDYSKRLQRRAKISLGIHGGLIAALLVGTAVLKIPLILAIIGLSLLVISYLANNIAVNTVAEKIPGLLDLYAKRDRLKAERDRNILEGNF